MLWVGEVNREGVDRFTVSRLLYPTVHQVPTWCDVHYSRQDDVTHELGYKTEKCFAHAAMFFWHQDGP